MAKSKDPKSSDAHDDVTPKDGSDAPVEEHLADESLPGTEPDVRQEPDDEAAQTDADSPDAGEAIEGEDLPYESIEELGLGDASEDTAEGAPDESADELLSETYSGADPVDTNPDADGADQIEDPELRPFAEEKTATEYTPYVPQPPEPAAETRSGGFLPMALGGVVAAALGFGAAQFLNTDSFETEGRAALNGLSQKIDSLAGSVEAGSGETAKRFDGLAAEIAAEMAATTSAIEETNAGLGTLSERLGAVEAQGNDAIAALDQRLTDLAKRPVADNVSREAIKAYEDELARLQATMENQRKAIEETIAAEKVKMEQIAADATQIEERALAEARLAAARSAMTRILSAIDSGDAFAAALAELAANTDDPVDPALDAVAADGVVTQADLRERFPDAARAALRASRDAGDSGGGSIGGILEKMFEVRSVEAREGDDVDAILSRAERAVRSSDLGAALTEIATLPEVAKAALAEWVTDAEARLAAQTAAQDIAARLNQG